MMTDRSKLKYILEALGETVQETPDCLSIEGRVFWFETIDGIESLSSVEDYLD